MIISIPGSVASRRIATESLKLFVARYWSDENTTSSGVSSRPRASNSPGVRNPSARPASQSVTYLYGDWHCVAKLLERIIVVYYFNIGITFHPLLSGQTAFCGNIQ